MARAKPLRVFISYSHDSDEHRQRVLELAQNLRLHGIDAVLDRFVANPPEGWPHWMRTQVQTSDFVLAVCTATYSRRFEGKEEHPGVGRGAILEGLLITEMLYDAQSRNDCVIPILFGDADESDIPLVLKPATRYRLPDQWLPLLRRLTDQPEVVAVPVGSPLKRPPPLEEGQVVSDGATTDVDDEFLKRVVEVCRLHEETERRTVEITLQQGPPPFKQFAKVRRTSPFRETYALATLLNTPDTTSLAVFRRELHERYSDPGTRSWLVYGGNTADQNLVQEAERHRIRVISSMEYVGGLIDFRSYVNDQTARLAKDHFYHPSLYVNQHVGWTEYGSTSSAEDAVSKIREWLQVPWGQFVVLLGDSGSGKTFALHELARRMGMEGDPMTPVLLEMKGLQKARSLDELMAQHFIEPLGHFDSGAFRYMLRDGRIALLFDGFDELAVRLSYEKALDHFDTLLEAAGGHAKIVVTIRAQFLPKSQIRRALCTNIDKLTGVRVAELAPFTEDQIRDYLAKKLGDESRAAVHLGLLQKKKGLYKLAGNPRMLRFIAEIPDQELGESMTTAGVYKLIVKRWLEFEHQRAHPRGGASGLGLQQLWQAVCDLALLMWTRRDWAVSLVGQPEDVRSILERLQAPAGMTGDETAFQVGSGTLLARDEDDLFTFLDDTLVEFLVGYAAAGELLGIRSGERAFEQTWSPTALMTDAFLVEVYDHVGSPLRQLQRSVEALLLFCACFSPHEVSSTILQQYAELLPEELSALLVDELALSAAVNRLQTLRLASATEGGLRVHPLIRALVLDRLPPAERQTWIDLALKIVDSAFPDEPECPERWPDCLRLLSQTLAVANNAADMGASRNVAALFDRVGRFHYCRGDYENAVHSFELALSKDGNGPDLWPAVWRSNLGAAMVACGTSEKALKHLMAALEADRKVLGDNHLHLAPVYANLGYALAAADRGGEAVEQLLAAARLLRGVRTPGYLQAFWLNGVGVELLAQGSSAAALQCLEVAALTDRTRESSDDHPLRAVRKWAIARALRMSGERKKAEIVWSEALQSWQGTIAMLAQVAGDEARAAAALLRGDLEQLAGHTSQTKVSLKAILDLLDARETNLARHIEKLQSEWGQLEAIHRGVGEVEAWGENPIFGQDRVELETEGDAVGRELERTKEEMKRTLRVAAAWREVMNAFVVRGALRARACGLCSGRCVLARIKTHGITTPS